MKMRDDMFEYDKHLNKLSIEEAERYLEEKHDLEEQLEQLENDLYEEKDKNYWLQQDIKELNYQLKVLNESFDAIVQANKALRGEEL